MKAGIADKPRSWVYPKAHRDMKNIVSSSYGEFKEQIESGKKTFQSLASIYTPGSGQ